MGILCVLLKHAIETHKGTAYDIAEATLVDLTGKLACLPARMVSADVDA